MMYGMGQVGLIGYLGIIALNEYGPILGGNLKSGRQMGQGYQLVDEGCFLEIL